MRNYERTRKKELEDRIQSMSFDGGALDMLLSPGFEVRLSLVMGSCENNEAGLKQGN